MPAKLQRIQYLRAAAALSVVLAHAIGDYKRLTGFDLLPMHYLGAAGVDLFFVISGFVMVQSSGALFATPQAAKVFLTRRWFRVAPLYWIVMAAYALLQIAQGKWHVIDPLRIVTSALFIPMQAPDGSMAPFYGIGWTLNYEMFFYVLFAMWIGLRRGLAVAGLAITLCAAVLAGQLIALPQPLHYWFNNIVLEFVLGMLIAVAYQRGWSISPRLALAGICVAVGGVILGGALGFNAVLPEVPTIVPRWIAWGLPCAAIVAAVALCRTHSFERDSVVGAALGDASYSMYLLHPIVIIALRPLVPTASFVADGSQTWRTVLAIGHIVLVVVVTALVSIASFQTLERAMIRIGRTAAQAWRNGFHAVAPTTPRPMTHSKADI